MYASMFICSLVALLTYSLLALLRVLFAQPFVYRYHTNDLATIFPPFIYPDVRYWNNPTRFTSGSSSYYSC